jgi:DNA gyrase subunit B
VRSSETVREPRKDADAMTENTETKKTKSGSEEYSASSLQVLEGLDAVRKRPGMYIGSTDSRGLQHCLWEIVDNAVDEALAGHCKNIGITLHADGSVEVTDDGRGIPTDIEPKTGLSGVEVVFTKLHAGGKFGGGSYAVSGGLHGVGASVVNALSTRLDVTVARAGATHTLSFAKGEPGHFDDADVFAKGKLRKAGPADKGISGTRVRYWPDRSIFLAEATVDLELTVQRARQTAFLVPGLAITVTDARSETPTSERFFFEGGMRDYVDFLAVDARVGATQLITGEGSFTESVPVIVDDALVTTDVERSCSVEIGLRWGTGYEPDLRSFVNIIATPKGGTHVAGFERALVRAVNDALKNQKVLKATEPAVLKEDCFEGLTAVVLVRLAEPQFEGQTKEVLGTAAVAGIVNTVAGDALAAFFADPRRKADAKLVLEKIANAARARIAARAQRDTIRRKNALESSSLPAKLSDCRSDDFEATELFIIEGDSAGGTVKAARDSEFQALMPIRGKILNTMRASEKQMLENAECAAIISAMGAGSGKSFDISNIRYGKLIVLADADVDGAHIRCLLLTLAHRYMRPLLEAGRVYSAVPPLYRISTSSTDHRYCYSDDERDEVLAEYAAAGKKVREVQRYKGLGEMDADQLADTTMTRTSRKLRRMTVEDAEEAAATFEMLMGNDVASRKEFIVVNGGLLPPDRIDA